MEGWGTELCATARGSGGAEGGGLAAATLEGRDPTQASGSRLGCCGSAAGTCSQLHQELRLQQDWGRMNLLMKAGVTPVKNDQPRPGELWLVCQSKSATGRKPPGSRVCGGAWPAQLWGSAPAASEAGAGRTNIATVLTDG